MFDEQFTDDFLQGKKLGENTIEKNVFPFFLGCVVNRFGKNEPKTESLRIIRVSKESDASKVELKDWNFGLGETDEYLRFPKFYFNEFIIGGESKDNFQSGYGFIFVNQIEYNAESTKNSNQQLMYFPIDQKTSEISLEPIFLKCKSSLNPLCPFNQILDHSTFKGYLLTTGITQSSGQSENAMTYCTINLSLNIYTCFDQINSLETKLDLDTQYSCLDYTCSAIYRLQKIKGKSILNYSDIEIPENFKLKVNWKNVMDNIDGIIGNSRAKLIFFNLQINLILSRKARRDSVDIKVRRYQCIILHVRLNRNQSVKSQYTSRTHQ